VVEQHLAIQFLPRQQRRAEAARVSRIKRSGRLARLSSVRPRVTMASSSLSRRVSSGTARGVVVAIA
jgi:hypothetical protein